jgi:hypothetical protein
MVKVDSIKYYTKVNYKNHITFGFLGTFKIIKHMPDYLFAQAKYSIRFFSLIFKNY